MKDGLSLRDRAILAVFGMALLYVVAAAAWFLSVRQKWTVALRKLRAETAKVERENRLIGETDRWNMEYLAEKAKMPQFPEGMDVDTHWLNAMDALATTNYFSISKRQAGREEAVGDVFEQPIDVSWEGSLESLVRFMWDIQVADGTMMDVKSLTVRPSSKKGFLKGSMTLSCAYMRGTPPEADDEAEGPEEAEDEPDAPPAAAEPPAGSAPGAEDGPAADASATEVKEET